eukprot:42728-Amphidinium_carterae.2
MNLFPNHVRDTHTQLLQSIPLRGQEEKALCHCVCSGVTTPSDVPTVRAERMRMADELEICKKMVLSMYGFSTDGSGLFAISSANFWDKKSLPCLGKGPAKQHHNKKRLTYDLLLL